MAEDLVARLVGDDALTDGGYRAGEVVARHVRERQGGLGSVGAAGDDYVAGVDGGGGDADLELARAGLRDRQVGQDVAFRWAVVVDDDRLHATASPCAVSGPCGHVRPKRTGRST